MQHNFSLMSAKYTYNQIIEKIVIRKVQPAKYQLLGFTVSLHFLTFESIISTPLSLAIKMSICKFSNFEGFTIFFHLEPFAHNNERANSINATSIVIGKVSSLVFSPLSRQYMLILFLEHRFLNAIPSNYDQI